MRRLTFILAICLFLLPFQGLAEAEKYLFEHIPTSNHWIFSIMQDSDGFMWLGTRNGLYRYLGEEQEVVFEGDIFYDIQQASDGRLWVKKRNGYIIYDPHSCEVYDEAAAAAELGSRLWIDVLRIDEDGGFWWNEAQDLYYMDPEAQDKIKVDLVEGDVYNIFCRNEIAYVLTVEGRLYRYCLTDDGHVKPLPMMGPAVESPQENMDYRFHSVFVDSARNIWLSQGAQGVWFYPAGSSEGRYLGDSTGPEKLQGGFICDMEEDAYGNVWLACDHGGIIVCNRQGKVLKYLKHNPDDDNTLASEGVYTLFKDKQDNIWVGYTKKGLSIYRGQNKTWSMSHLSSLHELSIPDDINATCQDRNGDMWFGTDGSGLVHVDRRTGKETRYTSSNSALGSDVITDIHADPAGRLWIGTFYGGLSCIENGKMKTYEHAEDGSSLASVNIWSIDHDASGRIWLGTLGGGLQCLDPETGRFHTYNGASGALTNDFIHEIKCAEDGNVYAATSYGLSIFNPHSGTSRLISNGGPLLNMSLTGLTVDSRGLVWLDEDGILQVFDPSADRFYTPQHGSLKAVRGMIEDRHNAVWVITDSGLSRVDVVGDSFHGYTFECVSFSFPQQENLHFNQRSSCMTSEGDFIIGSFEGYLSFSPQKYAESSETSEGKLHFIHIYAGNTLLEPGKEYDGKVVLEKALEYTDAVVLDHDVSVLSVVFASLDYFPVRVNELYYRMEGLSDEWLSADRKSNRLTFTNLAPGRYRLHLTDDMSDPSEGISLSIRIRPPWWATWLAIIVYVLLAVCALTALWLRSRRISQKKIAQMEQALKQERQQYVNDMKMQFFTNVSHDFRTPLTLILTPIEERMANNPELENDAFIMTLHRNAKRLNDLVNEVLDFRKMEMYGTELNLSKSDIVSSVRETVSSYRLMAESQSITLQVHSDVESIVFAFDQGKVLKIINNLLSNAFKFTPKGGSISVCILSPENGFVTIDVADTGRGVSDKDKKRIFDRFYQAKESASGSGIGLHIVHEFVDLHGGEISVRDNEPQGAVFTFTLPLREVEPAGQMSGQELEAPTHPEPSPQECPTVLVVDDNDDFRSFMMAALCSDYNVLEAADGGAALKIVGENDVDVVISDVMMPVMDGIELCRRMKSDINTSHIPVILLTAKALQDDECYGLESGADDYLTKPFNMSILRLRIAKFIEWKKRSKRLFEKELEITTEQITITSMDDRLLQQAINVINENISNPEFSVSDLSAALYMHRASLYKKLLYITGKTPVEFIRAIRLKRAAALLENDGVYISEIAYMVGFNSPKVFAGHFREEFGCSPSEYRKRKNDNN